MSHEWVILTINILYIANSAHHNVIGCERLSGIRYQLLPDSTLISFSSFYGLLDILSGTELNPGQRETGRVVLYSVRRGSDRSSVQTAKESCELLLKVVVAD